jgi:hypothetical protein
MTALTPSGSTEKHQRSTILQGDSFEDAEAYAYVQMAPPKSPRHQPMLPREYQQLGDRNQPQPYASVDDVHRNEQQADERLQNVYDIPREQPMPTINLQVPQAYDTPRNQGFSPHPPINLQVSSYDTPKVQERSRPASPFEGNVEIRQHMKPKNLVPPGKEEGRDSRRNSGMDLESMDPEQLQLLVSQLEAMGALGHHRDPKPEPAEEVEELYPELEEDDTYDTISDEEQPIYDDIAEPKPKPLYVNLDEANQAAAAASEVEQMSVKIRPIPPPRIHKMKQAEGIPRTKSVGQLLRSILHDNNIM